MCVLAECERLHTCAWAKCLCVFVTVNVSWFFDAPDSDGQTAAAVLELLLSADKHNLVLTSITFILLEQRKEKIGCALPLSKQIMKYLANIMVIPTVTAEILCRVWLEWPTFVLQSDCPNEPQQRTNIWQLGAGDGMVKEIKGLHTAVTHCFLWWCVTRLWVR